MFSNKLKLLYVLLIAAVVLAACAPATSLFVMRVRPDDSVKGSGKEEAENLSHRIIQVLYLPHDGSDAPIRLQSHQRRAAVQHDIRGGE